MEDLVKKICMGFVKSPIYWIIIVVGIISYVFYKKIVGRAGEHWVKKELKKLDSNYKIINDLMIKTKDAKTHQIDHVVISKYGIFVIETKQYNGYLSGNDYDKKWIMKSGKKKFYINNPVHQNYGHIESIRELLNIDSNKLISIVCVSSNAKLNIKSNVVVSINNLIEKISSYNEIIINNENEIFKELVKLNITNTKERNTHIKNIKKNKR